jgi:hypothetical protein
MNYVRLEFCMADKVMFCSAGDPLFFQSEMVPWQYRCIRRPEAGGMHRPIFQDLKPGKNLRSPPPAYYGLMPSPQQAAHFTLKKKRASGS